MWFIEVSLCESGDATLDLPNHLRAAGYDDSDAESDNDDEDEDNSTIVEGAVASFKLETEGLQDTLRLRGDPSHIQRDGFWPCPLCPKVCSTKQCLSQHVHHQHAEKGGCASRKQRRIAVQCWAKATWRSAANRLLSNDGVQVHNNIATAAALIRASVANSPSWLLRRDDLQKLSDWDRLITLVLDVHRDTPSARSVGTSAPMHFSRSLWSRSWNLATME